MVVNNTPNVLPKSVSNAINPGLGFCTATVLRAGIICVGAKLSFLDLATLGTVGIPVVFDYHHHKFCTGDQEEEEALLTACMTWGNIRPVVHYSQSRSQSQAPNGPAPYRVHTDHLYTTPHPSHAPGGLPRSTATGRAEAA